MGSVVGVTPPSPEAPRTVLDLLTEAEERATPGPGSEWGSRYRVLGRSAVWADMMVCEILTGTRAGEKRVLDKSDFARMDLLADAPEGGGENG